MRALDVSRVRTGRSHSGKRIMERADTSCQTTAYFKIVLMGVEKDYAREMTRGGNVHKSQINCPILAPC